MRILILAAHHDDETLGCGATMARLFAEGHEARVCILGEGPSARKGTHFLKTAHDSMKIIQSLGGALHLLGVPGFPDNRFDTIPMLEVAKRIELMLDRHCPDVVYTHHGGDLNVDHKAVHEATLIATRLSGKYPVKELYLYEVPSSTETAWNHTFQPNTFVDISGDYLDKKIQAMEMYETERRPFPHPRSPEALRALAMWRGAQSGCMAAEAFQLVRAVR